MSQNSEERIERCAKIIFQASPLSFAHSWEDAPTGTREIAASIARAVLDEAAKPAPGGPKMRDSDHPLRYCGFCRAWSSKPCGEGCHWEPTMPTPDFGRRNSPLLYTAAKKALNFIENTESELGIKLDSGNDLRSAIQHAIGHLYPPEPTVPEVPAEA